MKLMDLENERLRKRAFGKEKRKANKLSSGHARHMTAAENLDLLAQQDWESRMKDVFKEAAPRFKVLKKSILDYYKEIEKAKKVAEREAKKAEREAKKVAAAAERAARGRTRGNRGGGGARARARARGTRRGARGRDTGTVPAPSAGMDNSDSGLESFGTPESSEGSSDSDSESEAEIPIPRSRRQRPVRVIQGRLEEATEKEHTEQPQPQPQPRPRPRPLPRRHQPPFETRDIGEAEISSIADAVGGQSEPEVLREGSVQERP
jgi:hypothetical protein